MSADLHEFLARADDVLTNWQGSVDAMHWQGVEAERMPAAAVAEAAIQAVLRRLDEETFQRLSSERWNLRNGYLMRFLVLWPTAWIPEELRSSFHGVRATLFGEELVLADVPEPIIVARSTA